ncbi:MAG: hypothetical protein CVU38_05385 [Chloroflexi bacterium HGW-Chloroflexi-1]|nr:MAG: hypothetical protein CVU38_05385 [Chloroflexi bacterium HGW-Chloroflexi-1]
MSEEPRTERSIVDELSKLGKQVADAIKAAWESEDRKKLQTEITDGLQQFGNQVSEAVDKAGESKAATQIRERAEKVVTEVRESDVVDDVRKGLLTGLDAINKELGKLLEKLEAQRALEAPAESVEPPATPEPAEPPAEG